MSQQQYEDQGAKAEWFAEIESKWPDLLAWAGKNGIGQQPPVMADFKEDDMAFIATDSGGGDFKRVPPGAYIGRCFSLIDLGTQLTTGQYGSGAGRTGGSAARPRAGGT